MATNLGRPISVAGAALILCSALLGVACEQRPSGARGMASSNPFGPGSLETTVNWNGNGTTAGLCSTIIVDPNQPAGTQTWQFNLTQAVSGATHLLNAAFDDSTVITNQTPSKDNGSLVQWLVDTSIGAALLSASAVEGVDRSNLTVSHCIVPPSFEACSPGYWRNHPGYTDVTFESVFTTGNVGSGWLLSDALANPGSTGSEPNPLNANFIGTGAYLSALDPGVNFKYSVAEIIDAVQLAHGVLGAGGTGVTIADLEAEFGPDHDCPLN